jgi:3,4-dihydroxy 2-butanone 4-phosphate synthase / GTP cyclohydrolase II
MSSIEITVKEKKKGEDNFIRESSRINLPTEYGDFEVSAFGDTENDNNNLLLIYGSLHTESIPLVRIHSECLTSEVFGSLKCDCKSQLIEAINMIQSEKLGIILYLRQEGRGIGLFNKIEAYSLQETGLDTVTANHRLNFETDLRNYEIAFKILKKKGVTKIRLITNNPDKIAQLQHYGIQVIETISTKAHFNDNNAQYIKTKITQLGHKYRIND